MMPPLVLFPIFKFPPDSPTAKSGFQCRKTQSEIPVGARELFMRGGEFGGGSNFESSRDSQKSRVNCGSGNTVTLTIPSVIFNHRPSETPPPFSSNHTTYSFFSIAKFMSRGNCSGRAEESSGGNEILPPNKVPSYRRPSWLVRTNLNQAAALSARVENEVV
jgi:hypothetical protein